MGRSCTVCDHPESFEINEALVGVGVHGKLSNRAITRQYGLSKDAVRRHTEHIPQLLVQASRALEVVDADDLLAKVEELRLKAMDVLTEAEEAHDHRVVLAAIDRASKQLELLARLLGEISDAPQINIHVRPEWVELRTLIVAALEPHPEAQGAVLRAIESSGNGSA